MKSYTMFRNVLIAVSLSASLFGSPAQAFGLAGGYFKCLRQAPINFPGTITQLVVNNKDFSTLESLVFSAGLADALSGPGPFTVYAPTNQAFAKIPTDILTAIGGNPTRLAAVLTYHVSPGILDPRRAILPSEQSTLEGQTVFFNYGGQGPQVNQSNASCQAVRTSNGLVWVIDSVLLPQFIDSPE